MSWLEPQWSLFTRHARRILFINSLVFLIIFKKILSPRTNIFTVSIGLSLLLKLMIVNPFQKYFPSRRIPGSHKLLARLHARPLLFIQSILQFMGVIPNFDLLLINLTVFPKMIFNKMFLLSQLQIIIQKHTVSFCFNSSNLNASICLLVSINND